MIPRTTMAQADAVIKPLTLIEKLENRLFNLRKRQRFEEDECLALQYKDNVDGFKWALDIVKQHTCEWDDCSGASYVPCCDIVFCYNQEDTQPDFIFCPYCGGKIQPPSEVQDD